MIGTLNENTLHSQLKRHYCPPDGKLEYKLVSGYVADIYCPDNECIIEIQTVHFSNMKQKLETLTKTYQVHLVYPISVNTDIRTLNQDGTERSLNKSPLHGCIFQTCEELNSLIPLHTNKNLSIHLLFIESITTKIDDKKGRSRYKNPRIIDRELVTILHEEYYPSLQDLSLAVLNLLPETLSIEDVRQRGYKRRAGYVISYYKKLGLIEECGKVGRRKIYKKIKPALYQ